MNINEIKDLLAQFDQSTLTEFDLKDNQFELYFNKNQQVRGQNGTMTETVSQQPETPSFGLDKSLDVSSVTPPALAEEEDLKMEGTEIVSPLVGVCYLKSGPDQPVFKKVGDRIEKGEALCIIEAMKVMNEIVSDVAGELIQILVENEQVVEFNQPLFVVKEG
ncbi:MULTISPECIES: acetyl-CoA carboxylase biotin carboxyl carrier protein [Enterococcus]|uniref:acetyl-CoA carboxylase biotin carboxyl carrier protein n=1 Tax=Enterococcus TaxID=1350 RepID=UPI00189D2145|nr:acetyl-CoA carboxylase biotin carboxyl carrier protein [Enterococcus dispar]MCU7356147.1 acetyl-CoA carboxylase biotin carboxyl carrier protein [Enterococcus dispar]MDT2704760.1 acetyl-CoA carboxylase biotin carboxyl carrier protein [Enterococcus dispar]WCG33495.1 acetyl-CoA carboxylase biotin carboxyl carrier protein [Enterococcus dispar]